MGLTEAAIRVAKPSAKPYKLTDGHGLYLLVNPGGSRLWRWRYAFGGREKLLALGIYPDTRLAEARELRDGHRASLRRGVDPSVERRLARSLTAAQQVQSFEAVAREWHARQLPIRTERHAGDVLDSLEKHVFPTLGGLHVNAITPRLVLATLRTIEARPAIETAHRVRQRMSAVFVYAINRAGYHQRHVPHGWRAAFSSIMNERHPGDHDAIEATLAHTVPGARGAYMRASFLARRRELLTEWADLLLAGMPPAENLILGPRRYGSMAPTSAGLL